MRPRWISAAASRLAAVGKNSAKLDSIGEMLVMRSDGKLEVHNELDDAPIVQRVKEPPPPETLGFGGAENAFEGRGDPGRGNIYGGDRKGGRR